MFKERAHAISTFDFNVRKSTVEEKLYRHQLEHMLAVGEIDKQEYNILLVSAIEYGKGLHTPARFERFIQYKMEVARNIGAFGKERKED